MKSALVTGGSGFFGGVLLDRLLEDGWHCTSLDIVENWKQDPNLRSIKGDIRDADLLDKLMADSPFDVVFHCAAILAHASSDDGSIWDSNVRGTQILSEAMARHGVQKMVFISSNCLWGEGMGRPVIEEDPPIPVEIYGRSKEEGEKILSRFSSHFTSAILRSPTIIDSGRLGLLSILFDFILEGRKVWVVGRGDNRYQFVYAPDLADACLLATEVGSLSTFHVGSDDVKPLRDVYQFVIDRAGTRARIASLPKGPTLAGMRLANALGLSPLGPYHYRMIAEDFIFDTAKIKREIGWRPTLSNEQMLFRAYEHYVSNLEDIRTRSNVSAHRRPAEMGLIRVLKWLS